MKRKIISVLLCGIITLGIAPIGANAEWRQNSDNSWSWLENGEKTRYDWKQIDGKWYFFKQEKMQTGWLQDMYYYYLGNDGAMKTGWVNDGGKNYYLKPNGQLATDTVVDGIYVNKEGVSQPKEAQKVLLDNKYAKVTFLGFNETGYSKQLKIQIDNKSSQDIVLGTDKISVDGFMVYGILGATITVGNSKIDEIEFNNGDITTVFKKIQGKIRIMNSSYKELESDDFSINL